MNSYKYYPNVVVWGEAYINAFLNITLPSFLSDGNAEILANYPGSKFIICCKKIDFKALKEDQSIKFLIETIDVEFIVLEKKSEGKSNFDLLAQGHEKISKYVQNNDGYAIYLSPDCIVSKTTIPEIVNLTKSGFEAIMAPGFRINLDSAASIIKSNLLNSTNGFSGEELHDVFIGHQHKTMAHYDTSNEQFTPWPHHLFWYIEDTKTLLTRSFHLHPICVKMDKGSNFDSVLSSSIDGNFVENVVKNYDNIKVVEDNRSLAIYSLSNDESEINSIGPYSPSFVRFWAYSSAVNHLHRNYLAKTTIFYSAQHNNANPKLVSEAITNTMSEVSEILKNPQPIKNIHPHYLRHREDVPSHVADMRIRELAKEVWGRIDTSIKTSIRNKWRKLSVKLKRKKSTKIVEVLEIRSLQKENERLKKEIELLRKTTS